MVRRTNSEKEELTTGLLSCILGEHGAANRKKGPWRNLACLQSCICSSSRRDWADDDEFAGAARSLANIEESG
jgi:hypothetical protein